MIQRNHAPVEIASQNGRRVWAAQRRRLEWRVGRPAPPTVDAGDTIAWLGAARGMVGKRGAG